MNNKIVAHVGLGIVTYVPLILYVAFTVLVARENVFADGIFAFLGYFVTVMTMFGWAFLIAAAIISIRGLIRREYRRINTITLLVCLVWLLVAYWVITNFR